MNLVVSLPLLFSVCLAADDKVTPKFPVGKETTYVTGPLDKEGYIDYEAALNDRLSKGITPKTNANVLLWKALGPTPEGGAGMPAEFYKRLGIEEPPQKGAYFVRFSDFARDQLRLTPADTEPFFHQQDWASMRPWSAKDYPNIASWLQANEKSLAIVIEATRRPDYYNPLVSRPEGKAPGSLIGVLLPSVQKARELAKALAARAMLRVGEGKYDDAWQDLLACHRLARLLARGGTLIEALVGIALDSIASQADLAYLERAKLSSKQIEERLKDLRGLPAMPPMADKIDIAERFVALDSLQMILRGGCGKLEGLSGGTGTKPTAEELKHLAMIDWEPALRGINRWYDRMASALRIQNRTEREQALAKIERELDELRKQTQNTSTPHIIKLTLGVLVAPGHTVGKSIGDVLITLMVPAIRKVQSAHDRSEQIQRNLHVAFALAAFHADHKRYPAKVDQLAPKYLAAVPNDLFSGKPLIYRPSEKGYLLYSVGVNGKDEGGRWYDDDPPGDDPSVRMPLPLLKKTK